MRGVLQDLLLGQGSRIEIVQQDRLVVLYPWRTEGDSRELARVQRL